VPRAQTGVARPVARVTSAEYPCRRELHGIHFTLLEPVAPRRAHFAFTGPFDGQEVVWDATLVTLDAYHRAQPPEARSVQRHSFMEIGHAGTNGRAVRIGLDIPAIDEAVILRAIIMMRQYKRLRVGRHEFGEPRHFRPSA
jgi:hypothetical protein